MREKSLIPTRAVWAAALAGLCFFSACGSGEKTSGAVSPDRRTAGAQNANMVILRIGETKFTNEDFGTYVKSAVGEDSSNLPSEASSRLFDRFFDEKILLEAARRMNITLTEEEKRDYLAKISLDSTADTSLPAPENALSERIFDRLLVEKYVSRIFEDHDVTRAEIRRYYNDHKKDFLMAERVQVSQILYDTEQKAVAALRRLEKAPPAEFHQTARDESLGPEAVRGGLMGIYRPGDLPEDMEKVIFSLDEGRLSRVVESAYGFHIFRVDKKLPPHLQSEEEAAPAIRLKVLEEKYRDVLGAHIEELKNALDWAVHYENLIFSYQRLDG